MNSTISKLFFSALMVGLAACSPVKFDANKADGQAVTPTGEPPTPTPVPCNVETIYRKTKILFVVDSSGSNASYTINIIGGREVETPPTDPQKSFRKGAISDFLSDFSHKSNFNWGFMTFQGTGVEAYVNNGNTMIPSFTPQVQTMSNALNAFGSRTDSGQTPYRAALTAARNGIANDPDLNSAEQPNYFVVFLSDGFPTDYGKDSNYNPSLVNADIDALSSVAPGRVSLSTVFYGTTSIPDAINLLKSMAARGNGQFAQVNTANSNFKIDDVIGTSTCNQ
ncbi:MAG: VWA domain-containing protein [Proteobacteria bacterium]|nr:MAG: VWA domain-containing protein [Pseudomonadota bacterium]